MSDYHEAEDQKTIDILLKLLSPPLADVGQQVWWVDCTGGAICEGRIKRIEIGHYGWPAEKEPTRNYVARSERKLWLSYTGETRWEHHTHEWKSETNSGDDHDWWSKLCWTFDEVLDEAAKVRDQWAVEADRDAERRRKDAEIWRAMKTKAEAA